jgi:ubiquinone/menaquinone biosynthesis C-methylase UbiE
VYVTYEKENTMPPPVDLYNSAYSNYDLDVYREIRLETYGVDLGQTSWVNTEESSEIPRALNLTPQSSVLEIGSGSGRYALQVAETIGCRIVGVDINESATHTANQLAAARKMSAQVRFERCDVSKALPFEDATFHAAFSNDVLCHIPERLQVFTEIFRVLKPSGRMLFSDALVIAGTISHHEIATRSSIGYYVFCPPGENERLLEHAGFQVINARDTSRNAASIAKRWREAREARKEKLIALEGPANFEGLQQFLNTVHLLCAEGRLRRYLYIAQKPA